MQRHSANANDKDGAYDTALRTTELSSRCHDGDGLFHGSFSLSSVVVPGTS